MSEVFKTLVSVNVNEHIEKKNNLTYLSWSWAWSEVMERYPDSTYKIMMFDDRPFLYDPSLGYMVMTSMTIDGIERTMWLPVMDGANKAMKAERYSYQVKEYKSGKWTGGYTEKEVEPATMFDINTAIMRCLVKNIAMFGLGLYIYSGEDLPPERNASEWKINKIEKMCKETNINLDAFYRKYGIFDGVGIKESKADYLISVLEKVKEKNKPKKQEC